jgi:hypothetical protein
MWEANDNGYYIVRVGDIRDVPKVRYTRILWHCIYYQRDATASTHAYIIILFFYMITAPVDALSQSPRQVVVTAILSSFRYHCC